MTQDIQSRAVPDALAGFRLDRALARMFPEYSRSRLKEWLLAGDITVDGVSKRPRDPVNGGEMVALRVPAQTLVRDEPEPMALDIVFEDHDLLVINKPAGLVVHPGAGNPAGTLLNGLLHHAASLEEVPRAGIIHRIDKDTSGLLLVAKTLQAHAVLVRMLADRTIARRYLAVCTGVLTGGGTVSEPLARHPVDRKRMSVQPGGKPAITHYRVIERFRAFTYVDVRLESGRTHQIRVHFAHRRHALVGDPVYGGRLALPAGASDELTGVLRRFKRQALHAARLNFEHPIRGDDVEFEVGPPADFLRLIDALRADAGAGL